MIGNEKLGNITVLGGAGKASMATILVGAATGEVVGERERIAKDAAASVQSALQKGLVAGGGAAELAVARRWSKIKTGCRAWRCWVRIVSLPALKSRLCRL